MGEDQPLWGAGFLAALVHELRTPAASLLLTADLLAGAPLLDPQLARYAGRLEAAAADLRALLDEVGELNRLQGGRITATPSTGLAEGMLQRATEPLLEAIAKAGARLTVDAGASAAPLVTDSVLLERAVGALVHSALAAGARQIDVALRDKAPGAAFTLEVADDGEPVRAEDLPCLFVPFAVSNTRTRRPHGGTGLALPIAAAIAKLLGGALAASSAPGRTSLQLRLLAPA